MANQDGPLAEWQSDPYGSTGSSNLNQSLLVNCISALGWVLLYGAISYFVLDQAPVFVAESENDLEWRTLFMLIGATLGSIGVISYLVTARYKRYSSDRGLFAGMCVAGLYVINLFLADAFGDRIFAEHDVFADVTPYSAVSSALVPLVILWAVYKASATKPRNRRTVYADVIIAVPGFAFAAFQAATIIAG